MKKANNNNNVENNNVENSADFNKEETANVLKSLTIKQLIIMRDTTSKEANLPVEKKYTNKAQLIEIIVNLMHAEHVQNQMKEAVKQNQMKEDAKSAKLQQKNELNKENDMRQANTLKSLTIKSLVSMRDAMSEQHNIAVAKSYKNKAQLIEIIEEMSNKIADNHEAKQETTTNEANDMKSLTKEEKKAKKLAKKEAKRAKKEAKKLAKQAKSLDKSEVKTTESETMKDVAKQAKSREKNAYATPRSNTQAYLIDEQLAKNVYDVNKIASATGLTPARIRRRISAIKTRTNCPFFAKKK